MILGQHLRVDDGRRVGERFSQVVMVGDDHVHAARVGVVNRRVRGDARVAGDDERRAVVNDGLETLHVDAVTLLAADRDVVHNLRSNAAQRLDEQRGGGLSVHVEVAPNADGLAPARSQVDARDGRVDAAARGTVRGAFEVGIRRRREFFGMEERAGGGNVREAAPDEGPREKRGQVRERGGDVEDGRIEPAGHASTVP
ncbi:MAG: hypothetical protein PGMFKBFP_03103 [Anaerolineales bacterium]|nr:hypothetical protein [Anaerolineales bacterium]